VNIGPAAHCQRASEATAFPPNTLAGLNRYRQHSREVGQEQDLREPRFVNDVLPWKHYAVGKPVIRQSLTDLASGERSRCGEDIYLQGPYIIISDAFGEADCESDIVTPPIPCTSVNLIENQWT
jgi:hypothetical protein